MNPYNLIYSYAISLIFFYCWRKPIIVQAVNVWNLMEQVEWNNKWACWVCVCKWLKISGASIPEWVLSFSWCVLRLVKFQYSTLCECLCSPFSCRKMVQMLIFKFHSYNSIVMIKMVKLHGEESYRRNGEKKRWRTRRLLREGGWMAQFLQCGRCA